VRKELQRLYDWWTVKRPARPGILDVITEPLPDMENLGRLTPKYGRQAKKWHKLEDKWNKEDQAMLHKLIDVRYYLWT
jgi:hypothetical protein